MLGSKKKAKGGASPRVEVVVLQDEVGRALEEEGACTTAPCPIADAIFDQLFGRLCLQSSIIQNSNNGKSVDELLQMVKLEYEVTLEFLRHRRESTNRQSVHPEDDEEMQKLIREERELDAKLSAQEKELAQLEDQERQDMQEWLAKYGSQQLVHCSKADGLRKCSTIVTFRENLLREKKDLLTAVDEILAFEELQVASETQAPAVQEDGPVATSTKADPRDSDEE